MGLDLGTKTIGIALGDLHTKIVSPLLTIRRTKLKYDLKALQKIIADYRARGIILGLPLNMDGTEGKRCQATRQFAKDLVGFIDLPLYFWDERLTTHAALEAMEEMNLAAHKKNEAVDAIAASYILEAFLKALIELKN